MSGPWSPFVHAEECSACAILLVPPPGRPPLNDEAHALLVRPAGHAAFASRVVACVPVRPNRSQFAKRTVSNFGRFVTRHEFCRKREILSKMPEGDSDASPKIRIASARSAGHKEKVVVSPLHGAVRPTVVNLLVGVSI